MSGRGVHDLRVSGDNLSPLASAIMAAAGSVAPKRALLVGISGIGGSGKGYLAQRLVALLRAEGQSVAMIPGDDWLAAPSVRFDRWRSPENYYQRAMRLDDLYAKLIVPLVRDRGVDLSFEGAHTASIESMRPVRIAHREIDIVVLEGVYLFKLGTHGGMTRDAFDLRCWVDCTFETALERALERRQEDLPPDLARAEYEQVYFPAQRIHAKTDAPRDCAHAIIVNDPRMISG
ncbi:MAG: hypothetical protein K2W85_03815 [Phycisphaerales bacterium]|nr:hypothetical protein [Phycisphaerales bacterium]